jgi:hypothetical protein
MAAVRPRLQASCFDATIKTNRNELSIEATRASHMQDQPEDRTATDRRRGVMWWLGWALGIGALAVLCVAGGIWLRLAMGPVSLPDTLRARVEARLDGAMTENRLGIGEMVIDLPEGGRAPVIELRQVRLTEPGGAPRAVFPALRLHLDPAPLLAGVLRPRRVEIAGAELQLSRDAEGRFDLDLSGALAAADVSLPQAMARLDAMFAEPVFDGLQEVTATGLNVSLADAMTAQTMRIADGAARLTRAGGQLTLTLGGALSGSRMTQLDIAVLRRSAEAETEIALVFRDLAARDLATASPALGWLDLVRAPISGRLAVALSDDGAVGDLEARLEIGAGRLSLGAEGAPLGFERLAADLDFDPETRRLRFSTLSLDAPRLRFSGQGHADVAENGAAFVTQLRLADLAVLPGDAFPAPLRFDGAQMDMRLTLRPDLRVELGGATLFDDDLRLALSGVAEPGPEGLRLSLDAAMDELPLARVLADWPEDVAPALRRRLAESGAGGGARDIRAALRLEPGQPLARAVQMSFGDLTFRPLRDAPPIRQAGGYLEVMDSRLALRLDAGEIAAPGAGAVDLAGSTFVIEDLAAERPEAAIALEGAGPLPGLMAVLDGPSFDIFRRGQMTPERIGEGRVAFEARLRAALGPRDRPAPLAELGLMVEARIEDYASETLVPNRRLAAETLRLDLEPRSVRVSGDATLDGVPLSGTWERPLGPDAPRLSVVEATAPAEPSALEQFGLRLPEGFLSGQGDLDLRMELVDGAPPRLVVESDLSGVALAIPALGWASGASETGRFEAAMRLGPAPEVTRLSLSAPGLEAEGRAALVPGGGLAELRLDRFALGTWLDVAGTVTPQGPGAPPAIDITGGRVALAGAPPISRTDGASGGAPLPLALRLDRLEISDRLALNGLLGVFSAGARLEGEFEARVNGEAPVTGLVTAGAHGPDLRLLAADGGAVLRAAGLFRTAYGGRMALFLRARPEPRSYDGTLRIEGPRLRDAPAMAELLNAISVVGLLEQLSGDGINLGTVDARFVLGPERVTLIEGTAVGPAIGVSMSGIYDIPSRSLDMEGVVSPLYIVNGLAGALFAPRGEGLFGFSYRLSGTAARPDVSVNPLSILTPGIFRDIFRGEGPDPNPPRQAPTQ